jgi:hypothetical protein
MVLFALIAATGCDSKKSTPAPPAAPKVAAPAPAPAAPKPVPIDAAPDVTVATGALDFELVKRTGSFTLRDAAYELTFTNEPSVTEAKQDAPSGVKLKTLSAMASLGDTDAYGLFMIPIPKNVPYNIEQGMRQARDGAFNNVGVKMVSDVAATVGGIPGRKSIGKGTVSGISVTLELQIVFDKPHHTLLGLIAVTGAKDFPAATTAFLASLQIKPGEAPPAGDGT